MSELRHDLAETFPGTWFLPPTSVDKRCVFGIQWAGRTTVAEASDCMEAYHRLWRKAVRNEIFEGDRAWPDI